jgi:hypothetical protein
LLADVLGIGRPIAQLALLGDLREKVDIILEDAPLPRPLD